MIFIVTGNGERRPVSYACDTATGALMRARWFAEHGFRDLRIDAEGQKFTPTAFERRFVEPGLAKGAAAPHGPGLEEQEDDPRWMA